SVLPRKGPAGAQAELKARTLARGEELLGAAARGVGVHDLALGGQFVAQTRGNVPLLDAGGSAVPGSQAALMVKAGDVPVGVLAVEGHGQSLLRVDLQFPSGRPTGVFLAQGEAGKQAELKELDARIARLREQARAAPQDMRPLYAEKVREVEQRRAQLASAQQ